MVNASKYCSAKYGFGTRSRRTANSKFKAWLRIRSKFFQCIFIFVTTLVNQFSSFIKGSTCVCGQDKIFFCKTKIALSTSMAVWFGLTDDFS